MASYVKGIHGFKNAAPYLAVTLTQTRHVLPAISEEATPGAGEWAPPGTNVQASMGSWVLFVLENMSV